jgi:hypothetical protein
MARTRPELVADKWRLDKDPEDKLWYVANVTAQLVDSATTASSFVPVVQGVEVLEVGTPQGDRGGLLPVKLGGMGAVGTESFCTFRVTCANGEQFDRTMHFDRVSN